ncbi:MAG TPA: dihydroorotate dehydrogenase-like protein [Phycisphaerae bacterium]|nr:dihydroorotate dehydrogenase-like protein [Phycisphaerae bacterium]
MDLSTTYMGLRLESPLVAAASPLSQTIDGIRSLRDAGASAVVLWSLFEEQIQHEAAELEFYLEHGTERFAESLSYFPKPADYRLGPEEYLEHVARAKQAVDIPIIASLNGISPGGWISYAKKMEQAGADAIELNVYFLATHPKPTASDVENAHLSVLRGVKGSVSVPVAMKISPFFSSLVNFAMRAEKIGVDGLVLFNRFYQPDVDLDALEVTPSLVLSTSAESRLPMRWIAILRGRVQASLAATTGIHTAEDVAKMILVGADVTMLCSALLERGVGHLATVREGLAQIMERRGYESVSQMKGVLSQAHCAEPAAFERANYMKALSSYGLTATRE